MAACKYVHQQCREALRDLNKLFEIEAGLTASGSPRQRMALICFFCNAGQHRSVGMAEVFKRMLDELDVSSEICHVCDSCWRSKYCMGCVSCRQSVNTPAGADALRMMQAAVLDKDA